MKRGLILGIIIILIIFSVGAIFLFKESNSEIVGNLCFYGCKITSESQLLFSDYVGHDKIIYFYDIGTGTNISINSNSEDISHIGFDSEDKNKVFYMDERAKGYNYNDTLYIYDLTTKKEQEISSFNLKKINLNTVNNLGKLIVSGDIVYFMANIYPDNISDKNDWTKAWQHIFSFDIKTEQKVQLTDTNAKRSCLSKSNRNLLYIEDNSLILYHLDSGGRLLIDSQSDGPYIRYNYCPIIYDNKIVYALSELDDISIYTYDLDKKEKKFLIKIKQPSVINSNTYLGDLFLKDNELKYTAVTETLAILDDYNEVFSCTSLDLNSLRIKDITCEGGIGHPLER